MRVCYFLFCVLFHVLNIYAFSTRFQTDDRSAWGVPDFEALKSKYEVEWNRLKGNPDQSGIETALQQKFLAEFEKHRQRRLGKFKTLLYEFRMAKKDRALPDFNTKILRFMEKEGEYYTRIEWSGRLNWNLM